jgi:Sigma-54 interaction domain
MSLTTPRIKLLAIDDDPRSLERVSEALAGEGLQICAWRTHFLDEIGDMPLATQAKLLRVLQNRAVQRVGSLSARQVDVRVVAATNHNLRAQIAEKRFRENFVLPALLGGDPNAGAGRPEGGFASSGAVLHSEIRGAAQEAV